MVFGLLATMGHTSVITLDKVLRSSDAHNTLSETLKYNALALESKSLADTASDPLELYGDGSRARPELDLDGYEYTIGLSKSFKLGNIQSQERNIARLSNEAGALDAQNAVVHFRNSLKNLYHQYCVDTQNYVSFKQSYNDLEKLYKKKRKAYKYQEISKTELLQIESEKESLFAKLQAMKMMKDIEKDKLLMLSKVNVSKHTQLSCRDVYAVRTSVKLGKTFRLSKEAHEKRLESTQGRMERYSHSVESVNVSAQYGKELDMDKYTVGVSLPLNFTSKRLEHEKAAAMYQHSALESTYEQNMREKKSMLKQLKSQLKSRALMTKTLSKQYKNYKNKVLPLIKKSYNLGETSVIEYLLNRQKLYSLNQEVYATKKAYYQTLFTLYTLVEKKD